jgi:hypothetical protein
MSKQAKRTLATFIDPHKRGEVKRSIIQSELASKVAYKPSKGKRDSGQSE